MAGRALRLAEILGPRMSGPDPGAVGCGLNGSEMGEKARGRAGDMEKTQQKDEHTV